MSSSNSAEAGCHGSGRKCAKSRIRALLRGEGRFTDDLMREGQTHSSSPALRLRACAHRRRRDTARPRPCRAYMAVFSGAELQAAGVQPIGPAVPFPRPDGTPVWRGATRSPSTVCATSAKRWRRVVAESREAALDGAEAIVVDYEELPAVTGPVRRHAPRCAVAAVRRGA